MNSNDDLITAIATPIGEGGLSLIRVSGEGAIPLVDRGFRGKKTLTEVPTHTAHVGHFVDPDGALVDEVVITVYRAPHSYTAEDLVEITCHGGYFVTKKLLETIVRYGARLAESGEFTKRAFLNGRIDLSQAEAIGDLIAAKSEFSRKTSLAQLCGTLSKKVHNLRDELVDLCSFLELELDFVEEGLEFIRKEDVLKRIDLVSAEMTELLSTYQAGRIYREGIRVVISGRPNVGKSSLINSLLNENRVIVTDIPGTTRDVIEENITIKGILIRIIDTAGLRESLDVVEKEGIRRSEEQIRNADIILYMMDVSDQDMSEDASHLEKITGALGRYDTIALVFNKIDLTSIRHRFTIQQEDTPIAKLERIYISVTTGQGINRLKDWIINAAMGGAQPYSDGSAIITTARHHIALEKALIALQRAKEGASNQLSNEFIAADIRGALNHLGEIIGMTTTDEILDNIFLKFCVGK